MALLRICGLLPGSDAQLAAAMTQPNGQTPLRHNSIRAQARVTGAQASSSCCRRGGEWLSLCRHPSTIWDVDLFLSPSVGVLDRHLHVSQFSMGRSFWGVSDELDAVGAPCWGRRAWFGSRRLRSDLCGVCTLQCHCHSCTGFREPSRESKRPVGHAVVLILRLARFAGGDQFFPPFS